MVKLPNLSTVAELLDAPDYKSDSLPTLPLAKIKLNREQPRRYFAPHKHKQLVESIRHQGILQPLLVRPVVDGYELVAGERRYRAALEAELTEAPVIIKNLSSTEAIAVSLTENLQRDDLNPIEETEGILSLLSLQLEKSTEEVISLLYQLNNCKAGNVKENVFLNDEQVIITRIFEQLGKLSWESFVSSRLPLLKLPSDVLKVLREGKIEYTKARAIAKVSNLEMRASLLEQAIKEQLSLTQIKDLIASRKEVEEVASTPQQQVKEFSQKLRQSCRSIDPKTWRKIKGYMEKIENLLEN